MIKTSKNSVNTKNTKSLEKARSLNDIKDILSNIKKSIKQKQVIVHNLFRSVSNSRIKVSLSARDQTFGIMDEDSAPLKKTLPAQRVKTVKYKAPSLIKLRKHFKEIEGLDENFQELEIARSLVYQNFNNLPNKSNVIREIDILSKEARTVLETAYAALNKMAQTHVPSELQVYVDKVVKNLRSHMEVNTFSDIQSFVYVVEDKKHKSLAYIHYIDINDLRTPDKFVYDNYYVVITATVNKERHLSFYITTLAEFHRPGSFAYGKAIDSPKKAAVIVEELMAIDNIIINTSRKVLPVSSKKVKQANIDKINGVKSARMQSNSLFIILNKGIKPAEINSVITEVSLRLKSLLHGMEKSDMSRQKLLPKIRTTRKGNKAIQFILVPSKDKQLRGSIRKQEIEDMLEGTNFDPDQLPLLREALFKMGLKVT